MHGRRFANPELFWLNPVMQYSFASQQRTYPFAHLNPSRSRPEMRAGWFPRVRANCQSQPQECPLGLPSGPLRALTGLRRLQEVVSLRITIRLCLIICCRIKLGCGFIGRRSGSSSSQRRSASAALSSSLPSSSGCCAKALPESGLAGRPRSKRAIRMPSIAFFILSLESQFSFNSN